METLTPMVNLSNEPDHFSTVKSEHLSLALLRLLQRESGYCSNELIILDWFRHLALAATAADLSKCASDLEAMGLIRIDLAEAIQVLTLTNDGEDVALGRRTIQGVLRPSPNCPY